MVYALSSIGVLGFIVWSHHMYCVGLDVDTTCVVNKSNFIQNNWAICGKVLIIIWSTHKIMLGKIQIIKQFAGNLKISNQINKHRKPETDEE